MLEVYDTAALLEIWDHDIGGSRGAYSALQFEVRKTLLQVLIRLICDAWNSPSTSTRTIKLSCGMALVARAMVFLRLPCTFHVIQIFQKP